MKVSKRLKAGLHYSGSCLGPVYTMVEKACGRSRLLDQDMVIPSWRKKWPAFGPSRLHKACMTQNKTKLNPV